MATSHHTLPPDVQAALARGKPVEAIKLLRASTGLGLAEAKFAIEAYARHARSSPAHTAAPEPSTTGWQGGGMPPHVMEALRSGNKIEAIKRLREITSVDLKAAKDAVDAHLAASGHLEGGLAPGEVPRGRVWPWVLAMAIGLAIALWLWLRK